jgi:hypothetical protein
MVTRNKLALWQICEAPMNDFAGLAASRVREEEWQWRGGLGLLDGEGILAVEAREKWGSGHIRVGLAWGVRAEG